MDIDDRKPLLAGNGNGHANDSRRVGNGENSYRAASNGNSHTHRRKKLPMHLESLDGLTACILIACVTCVTTLNSIQNGMVVVAIPSMANDLDIAKNLMLWPASIHALTSGCTLLICGILADVLGSRPMYLWGCILQFAATLGCGLSQTGVQLIFFRALCGIASSFCLPSAVSIVSSSYPIGRWRNVAFSCMGGGQPVGFAIGLVMGGVFSGTIGWQWGFHISAVVNFFVIILATWKLPRNTMNSPIISWRRLWWDVDWMGAMLVSTSLAVLFYVLSIIADEKQLNFSTFNILLTLLSLTLLLIFVLWSSHQEKASRPALIPNSIWRNKVFTSICITVFLTWGSFNALEQFLNLFFQEIQHLDGLSTALRFLPSSLSGMSAFLLLGLFVHLVRADVVVLSSGMIAALSPLLLVFVQKEWSYWICAFPSILLNPLGVDALFTISILLISSVFPDNMQGLAGGVFNTVSSVGKSIGLAVAASIANNVSERARENGRGEKMALMEGYRAAFWYCFGSVVVTLVVSGFGLREVGKIGETEILKEEVLENGLTSGSHNDTGYEREESDEEEAYKYHDEP